MAGRKPIALVLCTGNSCRSQMAEAFLKKYLGDRCEIHSAGTEPKDAIHPLTIRVMAEVGIDISGSKPKSISEFLGKAAVRHLLIVCDHANDTCPRIWPGAFTRDYMPFDDPALFEGAEDLKLAKFRQVRDQIDEAMKVWNPGLKPLPFAGRRNV